MPLLISEEFLIGSWHATINCLKENTLCMSPTCMYEYSRGMHDAYAAWACTVCIGVHGIDVASIGAHKT
jgi:hypothetical protein